MARLEAAPFQNKIKGGVFSANCKAGADVAALYGTT
jgi:hypothetical protein